MTSRPSLEAPELQPLWEAARLRLERYGPDRRGRVDTSTLTPKGRYLAAALVGTRKGASIELTALEEALRSLGIGASLPEALASLGHPVSGAPAARRAASRARRDARSAARTEATSWPEPWAADWVDGLIRAGLLAELDAAAAIRFVRDVRAVLDRIARTGDDARCAADRPTGGLGGNELISRVDLAAAVLGSAHALDPGTRAEAAVTKALRHRFPGLGVRQVWERAGVQLDLVSAPVLTWGLIGEPGSPLSRLLTDAADLGVPLHLSQLALRRNPVRVGRGADVLVTENPRIVEAAAQCSSPLSVVALNGNPSGAARLLLQQLLASGASLRYHGDFDAAGLRICARMHRLGLRPWQMDAETYSAAVAEAEREGAELPIDRHAAPPTPWEPQLQAAFDACRRIVHEERLVSVLLASR